MRAHLDLGGGVELQVAVCRVRRQRDLWCGAHHRAGLTLDDAVAAADGVLEHGSNALSRHLQPGYDTAYIAI
jgi:hypothetical protein